MNEKYLKELLLLAKGLMKRGIQFEFCSLFDGGRIIVYDRQKLNLPYCQHDKLIRKWDAVCHSGSYGHDRALLEIMGTLVNNTNDSVEGFLTAEEILSRIDRR